MWAAPAETYKSKSGNISWRPCTVVMDVSSPWHIWNGGVLEWTQQATRSLTVSGTHRQAELFSRQQCYFRLSNNISRFYNRDTRALSDELAPIRDVWERCVQLISRKVNPEPEVTVGEDFAPRKMLLMAIHVQQSRQILHNLIWYENELCMELKTWVKIDP